MITITWPEDIPQDLPEPADLAVGFTMATVANTTAPFGKLQARLIRLVRPEPDLPIGIGIAPITANDGCDVAVLDFLDRVGTHNFTSGEPTADPACSEHLGFVVFTEAHAMGDEGPTGHICRIAVGILTGGWKLYLHQENDDQPPALHLASPDEADHPMFDHPLAHALTRLNGRFRAP